jgi:molybdopterin-guanine dinucleotide biosynthesis protein A
MQTAAILAGGRASRLGGLDKSRLVISGRTILERQLDALRPVAERVVIVTSDVVRYRDTGLPVVADFVPGGGSLGGIYTALRESDGPVLVLACDMPFVTAPFLARLLDEGRGADVALPRDAGGYHPLCACYAQTCTDPIRRRLEAGTLKVVDLLGGGRVLCVNHIRPRRRILVCFSRW